MRAKHCRQAFGAKKYKLVGLHCQRMMVILTLLCFPVIVIWLQAGMPYDGREWMSHTNAEWVLNLVGMPPKVASLSAFWIKLLIPGMVCF